MLKLLQLEDRCASGELTIQLVLTNNARGQRVFEKNAFDKHAESPAKDYLSTISAEPGHSIILVNAMGAYELYDDNRNGDSFPNHPVNVGKRVTCGHASCQSSAWISADDVLSKHYQTFERFGGIYKHHVNKDPKKSLGAIKRAFWNEKMQRVELLLNIEIAKDEQLIAKINDGVYPAVSMGCRIKYDVCSICGHRAPTRKEYCEHARNQLRRILDDGQKVCVHNPSPTFFDISFVFRPADPTGFMFKKVAADSYDVWTKSSAELGEELEVREAKAAEVRKLSDLRKQILGIITQVKSPVARYKPIAEQNAKERKKLSADQLALLQQYPINTVVSTLAFKNAVLSTDELATLALKQAGYEPSAQEIQNVIAVQPLLETICERHPDLLQKYARIQIADHYVSLPLSEAFDKLADATELARHYAYTPDKNWGEVGLPVGPGAKHRMYAPPKTDLLHMTDPSSGHTYQTTRGAAQEAEREGTKHRLATSALLGLGYYGALSRLFPNLPALLRAPVAGYGALKTYDTFQKSFSPLRNRAYMTDEGLLVPGTTEFQKVSRLEVTTFLDKVAYDQAQRVYNPLLFDWLTADLETFEKSALLCQDLEQHNYETAQLDLDVEKLATRLECLLRVR